MFRKSIISLLLVVLLGLAWNKEVHKAQATSVQQGIAEEILRFHVLANSDSTEDQQLKMQVKEEVLKYLSGYLDGSENLEETKEIIKTHLQDIETYAISVVKEKGYDYSVHAELTTCYFPVKTYGDCTFPAGEYEALRILIGNAEGHNWWCVLYPNLCFVDAVYGVVEDEEKEKLENVLTEEEYQSILEVPEENVTVKFRFLDWIQECFGMKDDIDHYKDTE